MLRNCLKIKNIIFFIVLSCLIYLGINLFYKFGTNNTFTSETNKEHEISEKIQGDKSIDQETIHKEDDDLKIKVNQPETETKSNKEFSIVITFTNAESNFDLQKKFSVTISSMLKYSSIFIHLHVLGDEKSQKIAKEIVDVEANKVGNSNYKIVRLEIKNIIDKVHKLIKPMQKHFSYKPGAYYSDSLFFLSIVIHKILPLNYTRIIMLDCDLKFFSDIAQLINLFNKFKETNVIGIGHDLQPVYRHTFWEYRSKNPNTRVGQNKPNGLQGFNSGVLLLDLVKLRESKLYNSLLNKESVEQLTKEFYFKGHLGDQDFFTLLSMKYEQLFFVLPCNWNRQLCQWWKDKGYEDVWDDYYSCEGFIHVYHGNCNTPIPF